MDIDLLAKKWEQQFTEAKNNPLYFALADLFRSYSKPLKLIENKVTFLEYLTFLEDHNVDAKTLVSFIILSINTFSYETLVSIHS